MSQPLVSNGTNITNLKPRGEGRSIGKILLDSKKLGFEDIERILRLQKQRGLRFGEAAIKLKLLTKQDVQLALSDQFEYSYLRKDEATISKELVAAYEPFGHQAEALRALRSQLLLRWLRADDKALAIVSHEQGEGRTYIAANLAIVFSQLGENTLLIDADMRSPRQHSIFDLPNRCGLSTVLGGRAGWEAIEPIHAFSNLSVLPAGAIPPNPLELLSRPEFEMLLKELSAHFDVIIIDTPAGEYHADAQIIASRAVALMVAHKDHTRLQQMRKFLDRITGTNGEVIGTVLNQF